MCIEERWCRWPRRIWSGSAAPSLPGLRVRIASGPECLFLCQCHVLWGASDWSLVQRSPNDFGVSECDREVSTMRRSWPIKSCCAMKNLAILININELKGGLWHRAHICNKTLMSVKSNNVYDHREQIRMEYTRVGTLIVATIYLQLIQNTYMFRRFTVLQCSHQHCLQPVASDVEVVGYL